MDAPAPREKLLRVQGARSRSGCVICKSKHLKCDEALPACGRCTRTNTACHYADDSARASLVRFVVYSIPKEPDTELHIPSHERQGLWRFQQRTLEAMQGAFHCNLWALVMPRMAQEDPIVRQAALALNAFHEYYLDQWSAGSSFPEKALRLYQKAQRQVIQLKSPEDSFDSILCACIIFSTCENLMGNFQGSLYHILAGMRIAQTGIRRFSAENASKNYPASMIISTGDVLPRLILALQTHSLEANFISFDDDCTKTVVQVDGVPDRYQTVEEAMPRLQSLSNELVMLYRDAGIYHDVVPWVPAQIYGPLRPQYDAIRAAYDTWARAVLQSHGLGQEEGTQQYAGFLLLRVLASLVEVGMHVFVHGEDAYDTMGTAISDILDLAERFLHACSAMVSPEADSDHDRPLYFTSCPEIIPVLFEIATRTTVPALSQKAIRLLRHSNRREGVWDGSVAAVLADKIVQLRQQGNLAAETHHVGHRFLITDIMLLSERKCYVRYGYKKIDTEAFSSFWLESIKPGQGFLEERIWDLP